MSEDWGPWIDHDGKGCPVDGQYVRAEFFDGGQAEFIAGSVCRAHGHSPNEHPSSWLWAAWRDSIPLSIGIRRYQVRKPRGMALIEAALHGVREEAPA